MATTSQLIWSICLFVIFIVGSAVGQENTTCTSSIAYPEGCSRLNVSSSIIDTSLSPFYEHLVFESDPRYSVDVDSVCNTLFRLSPTSYLVFKSFTFKNGSYDIDRSIQGSVVGYPGVATSQGLETHDRGCPETPCAYNFYNLGEVCPGTYLLYRCFLYGRCTAESRDFRVSLSRYRELPSCCKDSLIKLAGEQGFPNGSVNMLPGNLPRTCVTSFGGASCINSENVRPEDSHALEDLY